MISTLYGGVQREVPQGEEGEILEGKVLWGDVSLAYVKSRGSIILSHCHFYS